MTFSFQRLIEASHVTTRGSKMSRETSALRRRSRAEALTQAGGVALIPTKGLSDQTLKTRTEKPPPLNVAKIGIVSRDYRYKYENGFRDFSEAFPEILKRLDEEGCDTVLFSLYSIVDRKSFRPLRSMRLCNIKAVLYEEFKDGKKRKIKGSVVLHRGGQYCLPKWGFPSLKGLTKKQKKEKVGNFVRYAIPGRTLGNCCAILCGEINGVPYHKDTGTVRDDFGLRKSLQKEVTVVLNSGHDRMTRFEMTLKRRFLSQKDRWVISVWNKGKQDKNGRTHDGTKPPWTVFHNGREETEKVVEPCKPIENVEIGILEIGGAVRHWESPC